MPVFLIQRNFTIVVVGSFQQRTRCTHCKSYVAASDRKKPHSNFQIARNLNCCVAEAPAPARPGSGSRISKARRETMSDKIKRMLKNKIQKMRKNDNDKRPGFRKALAPGL